MSYLSPDPVDAMHLRIAREASSDTELRQAMRHALAKRDTASSNGEALAAGYYASLVAACAHVLQEREALARAVDEAANPFRALEVTVDDDDGEA